MMMKLLESECILKVENFSLLNKSAFLRYTKDSGRNANANLLQKWITFGTSSTRSALRITTICPD